MSLIESFTEYAEEPITRQVIISLLKGYKRPNDKINELVKQGNLTALKNGLYIPGPKTKIATPEPFLIANHLWGPSYVSLETALSHWGLIPERVYEISSVTVRAAKTYKTPIGRFSYLYSKLPYYAFGQESIKLTAKQFVLIASPEKALCDKIVMTAGIFLRSVPQARDFLIEDMRMEESNLKKLRLEKIKSWIADAPKKSSLEMLVKAIESI